jgi:transmembrane protein 17
VVATFVKTNGAKDDFDEIRPVMIGMYALFEPARLYAGYAGNLQEKVPMLIGFVALCPYA